MIYLRKAVIRHHGLVGNSWNIMEIPHLWDHLGGVLYQQGDGISGGFPLKKRDFSRAVGRGLPQVFPLPAMPLLRWVGTSPRRGL